MRPIILIGMFVKLFTVWFLALVAFFGLWALLAKMVKRISERKRNEAVDQEEVPEEASEPHSSDRA